MRARVYKVVSQILDVPESEINDDSSSDTIESWNSLKHMNLILGLEQEFNIQFSDEQIVELLSVGLIVLTVRELID